MDVWVDHMPQVDVGNVVFERDRIFHYISASPTEGPLASFFYGNSNSMSETHRGECVSHSSAAVSACGIQAGDAVVLRKQFFANTVSSRRFWPGSARDSQLDAGFNTLASLAI